MNSMLPSPKSLSGFLLIDKPVGLSSFDVIRRLRKITSIRKIGHAGTLDPFASGLMTYALGNYTRLLNILEAKDKTYTATIHLGIATDSGDCTGNIDHTSSHEIDESRLIDISAAACALTTLPVPIYSAVKIDGKRAYKYAREGLEISIPDRAVQIHEFSVIDYSSPCLRYSCRVSKGTYIRSLSQWVASYLGTCGHTTKLVRTAVGSTVVEDSVALDALDEQNWQQYLYPSTRLFADNEMCILSAAEVSELLMGRRVSNAGQDTSQILITDASRQIRSICQRRDNTLIPMVNLG
ncbi:MAG: tRNA pseudouridine(55) synthase TruB [Candidatus Cloacimonadaceae bacterium]|nr:tRNA pseudouridine(55) synthase TruB [Candidatus Cloacimonadaceae bacterium]